MLRTIGAVIIGWLIFAVSATLLFRLSGQEPHAPATAKFMIGSIIYGVGFGFLGGWVAASLAKRRGAALAVGIIIALGALVSLVAQPTAARWSPISALVLMAPAAALGGIARSRISFYAYKIKKEAK